MVTSLLGFPPRRADRVRDPVGDVRAFATDFEAHIGRTHPPFYLGSYLQVLEEAKKELKFLLVYLHSEEHQDTDRFCRATLADPRVVDYVGQNMLFWGCSVGRPEGYRVSEALRESCYPFLAVIVLRQNRMVVVGRQEGYITAPDLLDWLEKVIREDGLLVWQRFFFSLNINYFATPNKGLPVLNDDSFCNSPDVGHLSTLKFILFIYPNCVVEPKSFQAGKC